MPSHSKGIGLRGSPPQVRGKRPATAEATAEAGITPAGAGKTDVMHKA